MLHCYSISEKKLFFSNNNFILFLQRKVHREPREAIKTEAKKDLERNYFCPRIGGEKKRMDLRRWSLKTVLFEMETWSVFLRVWELWQLMSNEEVDLWRCHPTKINGYLWSFEIQMRGEGLLRFEYFVHSSTARARKIDFTNYNDIWSNFGAKHHFWETFDVVIKGW